MNRPNVSNRRLLTPCRTPDALHAWVRLFCGLDVPREPTCDGHDAPFEYLRRAYFEPAEDLVVWAPRGGGKTRLAAVATLLDLLHKPGVSVRVLGGSLEQSLKTWGYFLPDVERLCPDVRPRGNARSLTLANRSSAAVLTQSQRSVRGLRVQKLRCDEVELFRPDVWEAAQLVTQSRRHAAAAVAGTRATVAGTLEVFSTLHAPYGLMSRVIDDATARGVRVVRWCLLDVLERCPPERRCDGCALWEECRGTAKAKPPGGFVPVDDAIRMKRRVSRQTWEAEMLCRRPNVSGCVFPTFDLSVHVRPDAERLLEEPGVVVTCGIDFGFAAPFVCLWLATTPDGRTAVLDEYVQASRPLAEHVTVIRSRDWPAPAWVGCDPAGAGRNAQTATSDVAVLRAGGFAVRHRASRIADGLERVRAALTPALRPVPAGPHGSPTRLTVHPRCVRLIRALRSYRYPPAGGAEVPLKDGEHDHLIDALRYHYVNRPSAWEPGAGTLGSGFSTRAY